MAYKMMDHDFSSTDHNCFQPLHPWLVVLFNFLFPESLNIFQLLSMFLKGDPECYLWYKSTGVSTGLMHAKLNKLSSYHDSPAQRC
jgi:hypothetical protein